MFTRYKKTGLRRLFCTADGRGDRIRTYDLYVPNVALYQTELHPDSEPGIVRNRLGLRQVA